MNDTDIEGYFQTAQAIEGEIGRVIVGQQEVVRLALVSLLAGGHVLLEGVPGLGKTMLIRSLSQALDLKFARIQFTPDLMPADIVGTEILADQDGQRQFRFQPGPVFANLVLADEINRATPKTQSAMLEAMQEHSVTVAEKTYQLQEPFFVMATQNPIEMEGTYPLPEAQLDRFFFKIVATFPSAEDLVQILARTTGVETPSPRKVADGERLLAMRELSRGVPVAAHVAEWIAQLVVATHPESPAAPPLVKKYVRYGASPRGAQALMLGAKVVALLAGRYNVAFDDVKEILAPALRHRLLLNFEGLAENVRPDDILEQLTGQVAPGRARGWDERVIFDEATLGKLSRLTLVAAQVHSGRLKGERRSLKRGSSLEFADYRSYTPGDDLRRLDWKAYGRLDRPFLKLFEEEEDLQVHVLLDASASMDWGEREGNKFVYGKKLAAALGAIALSGGDCLYLQSMRIANKKDERLGPLRGKPSIPALLAFVEALAPGGTTDLGAILAAVTRSAHRPGLVMIISDLFSPSDLWSGLSGLRARGDEVVLIQPLAPDEIAPVLGGDLRLVDVETSVGQEVSIDGGIRRLYQRRLAEWRDEIQAGCAQRGIRFMPLTTAQAWDVVVLQELRRIGVAR